jgi:glycosyltransferase involved in cell wall biosynthesis
MRICFFGTYILGEGYPVNETILQAFRATGFEVVECHADLWRNPRGRWSSLNWFLSPLFWFHTLRIYLKLIFKYYKVGPYDLMIVGYLGHQDIFLAKLLNLVKGRPVVLIAFNSLYEKVVEDRRLFSTRHPLALFLHWIDRTACRLADLVLLDTQAHIDYFVQEFHLPSEKFLRVFVGSNLKIPHSGVAAPSKGESVFEVLFMGTYIPLHGIETIIRVAKILEAEPDLRFTLVGQGQLYPQIKEMAEQMGLPNLQFIGRWVPTAELVGYIARAGVCLGVFGKGGKAQRVIPCKVFDYLAMAKPLITADTPAIRELLTHGENAYLCPMGDEQVMARQILQLKNDPDLRQRIATNGYQTYLRFCTPEVIGESLIRAFAKLPTVEDL